MPDLKPINGLARQPDGVFSTVAPFEIEDFKPSRLYGLVEQQPDKSSANLALADLAESVEEEFQLSALRANLLRPFDFSPGTRVLEVGCGAGAITTFLAEQGIYVDAIESDRALAQIAALRTRKFTDVRVISELFGSLEFGSVQYDAVVLVGVADAASALFDDEELSPEQGVSRLLNTCLNLLADEGRIFLAADNRQGVKYLFGGTDERSQKRYYGLHGYSRGDDKKAYNLTEWTRLLGGAGVCEIYFLAPDFRFPRVLLGQEYADTNEYAFQHLEGIFSRDYFQVTEFDFTESLLHEAANSNHCFGSFVNSFLFVLGKQGASGRRRLDFSHLPDYKRKAEYLNIVKKYAGEHQVCRVPLFDTGENSQSEEPYIPGLQLSVQWNRQLLSDPHGIEFEQSLLEYFDYLKQLESGVHEGFNIDALPINIIVDKSGGYHLFDREWQGIPEPIDAEFVFFRAMVIFTFKNAATFQTIKRNKNLVTLGDFLVYCFKVAGIDPAIENLEALRQRDRHFQQRVTQYTDGYRFSDPLGTFLKQGEIFPCLRWRYYGQNYSDNLQVFHQANANNEFQKLVFRLPELAGKIECLRFFPYLGVGDKDAGYFGMDSFCLCAISANGQRRTLFSLDSADEIATANIHDKVFYAEKDGQHVFMFTSANCFVEIEVPEYELGPGERLAIEVEYRVARSRDYELAQWQFGLIERTMSEKLQIKQHELDELNLEMSEMNKIKQSRTWRLVQAYRDSFRISGYPEKNVFGKLGQLLKRFQRSE